jgi:hypothetical protein
MCAASWRDTTELGQCSGMPLSGGVQGPVTMVVTWPFVVTTVVSRSVPPGCDPQARPALIPTAKRDTASVTRSRASQGCVASG